MAGVDTGGRGGRELNRDINMVPFIDLLFVTIAFLLITAVWSQHASLRANAVIPGSEPCSGGGCGDLPEKRLHLYVEPTGFTLAWKQGDTVVSETKLGSDRDELAARLREEWRTFGSHADPADGRRDSCVLHTDNQMPYRDLAAVIDTVYSAKRDYAGDDGERRRLPAFDMVFASR